MSWFIVLACSHFGWPDYYLQPVWFDAGRLSNTTKMLFKFLKYEWHCFSGDWQLLDNYFSINRLIRCIDGSQLSLGIMFECRFELYLNTCWQDVQRELCFKICYQVNTEGESILCKHIFLVVINVIYDTFLGTLLCSVVIGERGRRAVLHQHWWGGLWLTRSCCRHSCWPPLSQMPFLVSHKPHSEAPTL